MCTCPSPRTRAAPRRCVRPQLFARMVEKEVPPAFSTYRAAINGSAAAGYIDVAVNYLDQMTAQGFKTDLSIQVERHHSRHSTRPASRSASQPASPAPTATAQLWP
eukprot:93191-Prymnesium_polylepis.1